MKNKNYWSYIVILVVLSLLLANCDSQSSRPLTEAEIQATNAKLEIEVDRERVRATAEAEMTATAEIEAIAAAEAEKTQQEEAARAKAATATAEIEAIAAAEAEKTQQEEAARQQRLVIVTGSIDIKDDEIFDNEYASVSINDRITLNPETKPNHTFKFHGCAGGEVRVELSLEVRLATNNAINVDGDASLFEGTSCNTTDREASEKFDLSVKEDRTESWSHTLLSTGTGGGDEGDIKIIVQNVRQS